MRENYEQMRENYEQMRGNNDKNTKQIPSQSQMLGQNFNSVNPLEKKFDETGILIFQIIPNLQ